MLPEDEHRGVLPDARDAPAAELVTASYGKRASHARAPAIVSMFLASRASSPPPLAEMSGVADRVVLEPSGTCCEAGPDGSQ